MPGPIGMPPRRAPAAVSPNIGRKHSGRAREVRVEMQKVTWPTRNDVIGSTIVVLVAVIALTLIITAWDKVLSLVLRIVFQGKGA